MSVTVSSFRQAFPEFGDASKFPEPVISTWLVAAASFVNADRWAEATDLGIQLFTAHNIVLQAQSLAASEKGNVPGTGQGGVVNSKSVDKVSVSYDTTTGSELDAGHWNLTTYGKRFIHFARMMGSGPLHAGAPGGYDPLSSQNAWPGPYTLPGWLGS